MEGRQPEGMDAETAKLFPDALEVSELGSIPRGWRPRRLGDLVRLQRGTTYKSELIGQPGPVLLGLASIKRDGGFRGDSLRTYGGDSPEKMVLKPGDIFVSLKDVTQSGDLLGAAARVPPSIASGRLTQDTVRLLFDDRATLSEFVYCTLRNGPFREYSRAHAVGTTNLSLSREDFLGYAIPVPPTAVLARLTSRIAALSARFEDSRQSMALVALRDALLPKLLSGELRVPDAERAVGAVL